MREVYFYADEVEEDDKSSEESSETKTTTIKPEENKEQNGAQTVCDIASEFIKCLSRQKKVILFKHTTFYQRNFLFTVSGLPIPVKTTFCNFLLLHFIFNKNLCTKRLKCIIIPRVKVD